MAKVFLTNQTKESVIRILEFDALAVQELDLYTSESSKAILKSGFSRLDVESKYRNPTLRVSLAPGESRTFILRMTSNYSMTSVIYVHTEATFLDKSSYENSAFSFYFGVVFFTIIFHILLGVMLKHLPYIYYSLVLSSFHALFVLSNYGILKYNLMPSNIWFNDKAILFSSELTQLFAVSLLTSIFTVNKVLKKLFYFVQIKCVLVLVVGMYSMNYLLGTSTILSGLTMLLVYLFYSVFQTFKGSKIAVCFALGWLPSLIVNGVYTLISSNVLSFQTGESYQLFTVYGVLVANTAQLVLLSFSIALQFNEIRKQSRIERQKRMQTEKEAKERENKILRDYNEKLSQEVEEKTREVTSLLDNIPQGVLSIQTSGQVGDNYSAHLEQMFDCKTLVHQPFLRLLQDSNLGPDEIDQAWQAINFSLGLDPINFLVNEDKLPRELVYKEKDQKRVFRTTWSPQVVGESLDSILVTFQDITSEKLLEIQSKEKRGS